MCANLLEEMSYRLNLLFTSKPYSVTTLLPVLIFRPPEGGRLSWPEWLVTCRDGLPVRRRSPIQVITGPDVEQVR